MKYTYLLCGLALFTAGTAHAREDAEKAFDGPRFGVSLGSARTSLKAAIKGEEAKLDTKKNSFDWRAHLGYDFQTDSNIVLGAELGISGGGKSFNGTTAGKKNIKVNPGRSIDLTARAGYAINNSILLFGKAGWAWQSFALQEIPATSGAKAIDQGKIKESGFLFGGGAEVALSPNIAIRAEYDRVKFSDDIKRNRFLVGAVLRM